MKQQIVAMPLLLVALALVSACGNQNPAQPSATGSPALGPTSDASSASATYVAKAKNSEQLVFSGVGQGSSGPVGFWIWCEVDSSNPYAEECNGSMYFYALGLTKHVEDVEGSIVEGPDETYQFKVISTKDNTVACTLANPNEPVKGPNNIVTVDCTSPSVSAVSNNAVVTVTGPGN
jgi:hypothetical protein